MKVSKIATQLHSQAGLLSITHRFFAYGDRYRWQASVGGFRWTILFNVAGESALGAKCPS